MGILFTIAAIIAIVQVPLLIAALIAGKTAAIIAYLIAFLFFGAISAARLFKNKDEVTDSLRSEYESYLKDGYTAEEATRWNNDVKATKKKYRFEFITFPWWELKHIKLLNPEKATKTTVPKTEVTEDSREKELEKEIEELNAKLKAKQEAKAKSATDETAKATTSTESTTEQSTTAKQPDTAEQSEPKKTEETAETREPVKDSEGQAEKSAETTEVPAEKTEETAVEPYVYTCEIITPKQTAYNKAKKTYRDIMADLGIDANN